MVVKLPCIHSALRPGPVAYSPGRGFASRISTRDLGRDDSMQVISFMNMKGGVGKTTLAVNVAYGLAQVHNRKVLLVDGDPQFNASQFLIDEDKYLAHIDDPKKGTVKDIFMPKKPGPVSTAMGVSRAINKAKMTLAECSIAILDMGKTGGKLDIIPSTLALLEVENAHRLAEMRLKSFLEARAQHYDYVLIDCPPTISIFTQAAILASQKYLVPIRPDPLSVIGLPLLERWLEEFTDAAGTTVTSVGIVFTQVRSPAPRRMQEVMADLRKRRQLEVFENELHVSTDVAESVEAHEPVFRFRKGHKTANQILDITKEFLERTGG
jgi:chromosome partitioning protein